MVFDVGLQCATLVSVTVLAYSWSCEPYLGNVLSAWLLKLKNANCLHSCNMYQKSLLFYLYVYFNFVRRSTE